MNDCEKYLEKISVLTDGQLSREDMDDLGQHLRHCPDCNRVYGAFLGISRGVSFLEVPAPPELAEEVMGKIKPKTSAPPPERRRGLPFTRLALAAACLALAAFGVAQSGLLDRGGGASPGQVADMSAAADPAREEIRIQQMDDQGVGESFQAPGQEGGDTGAARPESAPEADSPAPFAGDDGYFADEEAARDATASLFDMSMAEVYSGEDADEPLLTITDEESLLSIARLLSWSKQSAGEEPAGEPVFVIGVTVQGGEMYTVRVWVIDGSLWCAMDPAGGGGLYLAQGSLEDLLELISQE